MSVECILNVSYLKAKDWFGFNAFNNHLFNRYHSSFTCNVNLLESAAAG